MAYINGQKVNNASLPNLEPYFAAGINPKTGLLVKFQCAAEYKENIKKQLRIVDEQDAVNRYVWYNLPCNLSSQELERMLYYRGQICFFYDKNTEEFYFMPYALDGTIDFYGRYNKVHPVPWASAGNDKANKVQEAYLSNIKLNCIYGIKGEDEVTIDDFENDCVLLHDYTKQISQTIIPRQTLNDSLLDIMAECVPMMRTALKGTTGVRGVRVNDADQASSVFEADTSLQQASLTGDQLVPIVGTMEFQELADGQTGKAEEFMLAMQSLDNFRLSTYGIDNGGLFEKKAHELQSEADLNGGPVGLVLQDGLSIRQNFCNIVNSIWDIGIWCEPAENIIGADTDGDGLTYDRNDDGAQSGISNSASPSTDGEAE